MPQAIDTNPADILIIESRNSAGLRPNAPRLLTLVRNALLDLTGPPIVPMISPTPLAPSAMPASLSAVAVAAAEIIENRSPVGRPRGGNQPSIATSPYMRGVAA